MLSGVDFSLLMGPYSICGDQMDGSVCITYKVDVRTTHVLEKEGNLLVAQYWYIIKQAEENCHLHQT